ncbi:hypothetical protein F5Y14DRAFT_428246 [Nemania sp. NC0429]|nr:hypothetical protein F5Y14DRAFT_428246 [Nemania sp. NC0429]
MRRLEFAPTLLLHLPLPIELDIKKPASIFAFAPDDKVLLTVHGNEGGILWDLTLASSPRKLDFKQDGTVSTQLITSAVLLGEGRGFILGFGINHPARHYEMVDGSPGFGASEKTLPAANDIAISQDGKIIVFSTGTTVEVWDATTVELKRVLSPTADDIRPSLFEKVVISGDSRITAAVNATGQLNVWGIEDDFYKVSPDRECGLDLGDGWQPASISLDKIFAMAVLRRPGPSQTDWVLVRWGFAYQGPDRTLYYQDFPPCALACIPPSPDFVIMLTAQGRVVVKDTVMFPICWTDKGASKKGKVVACGSSGSGKMLAVARSNGRLAVWRLNTQEVRMG